jgi:pyruvate/2-oxoglutarate dehydrogenase complex dihydrolipoamide acyltransferase (E2) component
MVLPHQKINEGDVLVILEAMKMETEIKAARSGVVASVSVKEGDAVTVFSAGMVSIISFSAGVASTTTSAADFIEVILPPADTSTL